MSIFKLPEEKGRKISSEIDESFLANLNHALITPLNGMLGMLDLLGKTGLNTTQEKYMKVLRESSESLMLQLDNVVELEKIRDKKIKQENIETRLEDVVKNAYQPFISTSINIRTPLSLHFATDVPEFVKLDSYKLQLIIANLLNCTLKCSDKTKIVLNVSLLPKVAGEKRLKLRFSFDGNKVINSALSATSEEYRHFTPSNLKDYGEVTVSLLTSHNLLETIDSFICQNTDVDKNTSFHFDVPFEPSEKNLEHSEYSIIRKKRVLIFQHDVLDMDIVIQSLKIWQMPYTLISDENKIIQELKDASNHDRPYSYVIVKDTLSPDKLEDVKKYTKNIIIADGYSTHDDKNLKLLHPSIHPAELLSVLSSCIQPSNKESTFSEDASNLVTQETVEPIKARALVVEDDLVNRMYIVELLSSMGCDVAEAEDGQHALAKVVNYGAYDVVFMDCIMPRMDGYEATRKMREKGFNDMPIIALTASTLEEDRKNCLKAGMTNFLPKPVREQDLYAILTKILKK